MSSVFFSGLAFGQGKPVSDREGIQKPGQARVPKALRGDEVIEPLRTTYHEARVEFRDNFKELRQKLADATEEDKSAIAGQLRELLVSNRQAQRDFRHAMRDRMKELRNTDDE